MEWDAAVMGNPAASRACTAREFLWEKTLTGGAALRQQSLTGGPKRYRGPQGRDTEREPERSEFMTQIGLGGAGPAYLIERLDYLEQLSC
jgi:hypothetical protein